MMAYIDRDKLLEELQEEIDFESAMYTEEQNKWFKRGLKCAYRDAKNQPTADVEEVRHGEWMKEGCCFYCSECKKTYGFGSTLTIYDVKRHWLHCPNCGAKTDGGKDENV